MKSGFVVVGGSRSFEGGPAKWDPYASPAIMLCVMQEGLALVRRDAGKTGFKGVAFKPSACALLCKPYKVHYREGDRIEHLGYFASAEEGALAYARRLGPEASSAAAAAAAAAPEGRKAKGENRSSNCARASLPPPQQQAPPKPPPTKKRKAPPMQTQPEDPAARFRAQLTSERLTLMAAIARERAAAASPPTAKALHTAVAHPEGVGAALLTELLPPVAPALRGAACCCLVAI